MVLPRRLLFVGDWSFHACKALRTIAVPSTVHSIGASAFACSGITDDEFSEGLEFIGFGAYGSCRELSAIAFPATLDTINGTAFVNCTSLLGVEFPAHCTSPRYATQDHRWYPCYTQTLFSGCNSLVNVSLPSYVVDETDAFPGCLLLQAYGAGVKDRHARFPVHEVCYNSSSATVDDLIQALDSSEMVEDEFGLTAFHIVATSANPRVEILECLLDRCSFDTLCRRDGYGKTMLDYLLMNTSSKVVPLLTVVLEKAVLDRMAPWHIGERWRSFLALGGESINDCDSVADIKRTGECESFLGNVGYCLRVK